VTTPVQSTIASDARAIDSEVIALRRELHGVPEVGLQLPETQRIVLRELDGLGLEITTGRELSSVVAVLRGGAPGASAGPAVLLRADMDALPVREATGLPHAPAPGSPHADRMHACGHDIHTAALIGAARLLAAGREELEGDVVFMFQPGEEGFDGAGRMIDEGVLDAAGRPLAAAYGLHVFSSWYSRGSVTTRPGTVMAGSTALDVTVRGAGGHASAPHRAKDPIVVAAEILLALQTMVTRTVDVFDPVVITAGSFSAGAQRNIIPTEASFSAIIRSFSRATGEQTAQRAVTLATGIAAAHGLVADIQTREEFPITVNDSAETARAIEVVERVLGPGRFEPLTFPQAGSEDFSRVLQAVPGAYLFVGAAVVDDVESAAANHSPSAMFDESLISDCAALLAGLALERIQPYPREGTDR